MGMMVSPYLYTASAPSWTPADYFTGSVAGAYYDISDISTLFQDTAGTTPVTASGQSVNRVNDKSGNGHHLTATTTQPPIYRTDGGAGGDKPYLDFDGVNDVLKTATFTAVSQPHYQGIAVKQDTVAATMFYTDGGSGGNNRFALGASSGGVAMVAGATGQSGIARSTNDIVVRAVFNGASSQLWVDTTASATLNAGTHQAVDIHVGHNSSGSATPLDGRFYAGFFTLGNTPDSTAQANVLTWLASKQGRSL
jgi:hypothetical protein